MWGPLRKYGQLLLGTTGSSVGGSGTEGTLHYVGRRVLWGVRVASFWLSIPLPFLYLPVLFSGLDTRPESVALGAMLVLHVVALSLGYPYAADQRRSF